MARMVDLIRDGIAPPSMMRRAAQGGLSLPPHEAIEVLVALTRHREFGVDAEQTLDNWNEQSLLSVASNAQASLEVLVHLLHHNVQRPAVVAALCNNPALPLEELHALASQGSAEVLRPMLQSARVRASGPLRELISSNPAAVSFASEPNPHAPKMQDGETDEAAAEYIAQHSTEIATQDQQPFELVAGTEGEEDPLANLLTRSKRGEVPADPIDIRQLSLLQRISRLRVGERIKLAMRGNREERMVLIRDRSKLVSLAVLESPKVTDTEMESFAAMKNVQETVLRAISTKRKYMKQYGVLCALVTNPKTPLDVALPLVARLFVREQQALARNKNVNDTIRKMAIKLFRLKAEKNKDD